jgi:phage portal protein BeeE
MTTLSATLDHAFSRAETLSGRNARPVRVEKSTADFAEIMVGPVHRHTRAEWLIDRNAFLRANRNSVFIASGAIARKMAMQEIKMLRRIPKKSGTVVEPLPSNHPLCQLFFNVNPRFTEWDLWFYTEGWKMLTGNAYWWKGRNLFGTTKEVWPMPSQFVRVIPSRTQYVEAYEIRNLWHTERPVILPASEIVEFMEPNLDWYGNGRFYGSPTLWHCGNTTDIEMTIYDRLRNQFQNYAPPGQIFSTDKTLTEPQVKQVYNQIINQHTLVEHSGRPMITHSGLKPMMQQSSVKEMDFRASLDTTLTMTLATFGVPKAVVGLVADANRSNMESAIQAWAENTINPRLKHNAAHITRSLVREFEPAGDCFAYFSPVVPSDIELIHKAVDLGIKGAALDQNEVRELLFQKKPFRRGGKRPIVPKSSEMAEWGNDEGEPQPGIVAAAKPGEGQPSPDGASQNHTPPSKPTTFGGKAPGQDGQNGSANGNGHAPSNGKPPLFGRQEKVRLGPERQSLDDLIAFGERDVSSTKGGDLGYGGDQEEVPVESPPRYARDPNKPRHPMFEPKKRSRLFKSEQVDRLVREWEAAHESQVAPFTEALLGALETQKSEVISRYETFSGITKSLVPAGDNGTVRLTKAVNPDSAWVLLPPGRSEALLLDAAVEPMFDAAIIGAQLELRHVSRFEKAEVAEPKSSRRIKGFMEIPPSMVKRIRHTLAQDFNAQYWRSNVTGTTRQRLRDILLRAIEEGWTPEDTATYISEDSENLFNEVRAERIARTEITAALAGGQWSVQEDLIARNIVQGRQWVAIRDRNTREMHLEVAGQMIVQRGGHWVVLDEDGTQVGEGRLFILSNGERARFPGDPGLSPENRVNCRCTVTSVLE